MTDTILSLEKIHSILEKHDTLSAELAGDGKAGFDAEEFARLSKEFSEISPVAEKARAYLLILDEIKGLDDILDDADADAEMKELANLERPDLVEQSTDLAQSLQILLLPKDAADSGNAILEVRAGTGGDEAALFAGDLFRMYHRYCDLQGWKIEVLSESDGDVGGYKEIIASVSGKGVFARLKFESGVHRVQRVPTTESGGRIHTSAATVAVLPEAQEVDIDIRQEDLRIDTMRASGAGGQHVNTD